jgi:hypothetical protein
MEKRNEIIRKRQTHKKAIWQVTIAGKSGELLANKTEISPIQPLTANLQTPLRLILGKPAPINKPRKIANEPHSNCHINIEKHLKILKTLRHPKLTLILKQQSLTKPTQQKDWTNKKCLQCY